MSHTIGLTNYFLRGQFKSEINYANTLGAQGKLAIGYAKLIKQLWYDEKDSVAPYFMKTIIGRFRRQFNN